MPSDAAPDDTALKWAALLLVAAAAVFGGASRENAVRLAVVEIAALPLAVLVARRRLYGERAARFGLPAIILGLILAIPVLQSIPLPPSLWTILPGQSPRVEALRLAGLAPGWRSLTLAPRDTQNAILALLPPVAMVLGAVRLDRRARDKVALTWIALTAIGLVLGAFQIATPDGGSAYPYATTNLGSLVGWFANRNHEAGCLLATLPFAAILAGRRAQGRPTPEAWAAGLFGLIAVAALGVIRSRAGIILAAPVLTASLVLIWRERRPATGLRPGFVVAALLAGLIGVVVLLRFTPILDRLTGVRPAEFRLEAWPIVAKAAWAHLPFGAGMGAFDRVFRAVEPLRLVVAHYFNHAHDDYLEVFLEAGWLGVIAFGAFAMWAVRAVRRAWGGGGAPARAASIAILALLAQSLVDYPLRTEALAVWFAFCCGLLAAPDDAPGPRSAPS